MIDSIMPLKPVKPGQFRFHVVLSEDDQQVGDLVVSGGVLHSYPRFQEAVLEQVGVIFRLRDNEMPTFSVIAHTIWVCHIQEVLRRTSDAESKQRQAGR